MQQPRTTSGLAVASLVLGLLWLGGIGALLALIFGLVALSQIKSQPNRYQGRGMAIAGVVLGAIGIVVPIIAVVALVFVADEVDTNDNGSPVAAAETTVQQQTITAPPATEPALQTTTTLGEPAWTMGEVVQLLSTQSLPSKGMDACGGISIPSAEFVIDDSPVFVVVGVFDTPDDATAYLDAIEQAIAGASTAAVSCVNADGSPALTFVDPSTASRVDADTLDEQVTVQFAEGGGTTITQREVRCGNVVVAGSAAELPAVLQQFGC